MGDISNKNFELTDSAKLKMSLLDNLRNNPNKKQIIKLKGNSSLLFANLTALTLASCGGGGGRSSSPTPSFSFSNQNFTFTEDSSGTFSISAPTNAEGTVSITVNSDSKWNFSYRLGWYCLIGRFNSKQYIIIWNFLYFR